MAISITKSSENGNYSNDFKSNGIPATQGNVVETIDAYNEQIKKHYYDKTEARGDTNALQTSIMEIVKQLVKDTAFTNKTIDANENSDIVEQLESNATFNEDNNNAYDNSGLLHRVEIIANLLSGTNDSSSQIWTKDAIGNNVGGEPETTVGSDVTTYSDRFVENTPVIGMTRADGTYTASVDYENGKQVLNISGLSSVPKIVNGEKTDEAQSVAEHVVLSEKQVADMIKQSVIAVLGSYDNQIGAMLGYLMFTTDSIPDSFATVLKNTKNEHIGNIPLYVKGYDTSDDSYYIQDLNGLSKFTGNLEGTAYKFSGADLLSDDKYWKITANSDYKKLTVTNVGKASGEDEISYTIPIPQYLITLDFGYCENTTTKVINDMSMFNSTVTSSNLTLPTTCYGSDGKATVEVPLGSRITIKLPGAISVLNNTNFYVNDDNAMMYTSSNDSVNYYIHEDQKLYCNYCTVKVVGDNGNNYTGSAYEGNSLEITPSQGITKTGYTLTGTTEKGGTVTNASISYSTVTESFSDKILWTADSMNITYNVNGGTAGTNAGTTSALYDSNYTIDADDPTREGYDFDGWVVS